MNVGQHAEPSVFHEVDAAACPLCRQRLRRLFARRIGARLFVARRAVAAPANVALAVAMLDTLAVSEARDALMTRLPCSRRTAYRIISAALQARAKPRDDTA